jgi:hypothetical protein
MEEELEVAFLSAPQHGPFRTKREAEADIDQYAVKH